MENPHYKILITGGAGYIGSHAVKHFVEKGHDVVVFDNLVKGFKGAVDEVSKLGNVWFYRGDLTNISEIEDVFEKEGTIDAVIHFAAYLSVSESVSSPDQYFRNNVVGTMNLLDTMTKHNVKKLVFSSQCAVYGESDYLPLDENHPTRPTNSYGQTRLAVEKMIKWYDQAVDIKHIILRYFNVCGASTDGIIGDAKTPSVHLMQNVVKGALGLDKFNLTYSKVDTPDGSPIRDYVDVNDLIDAHYLAYLYLNKDGQSETLNLGSGKGYSVEEIVKEVEGILGVTLPREFGEPRQGEYAAVYANYALAKELIGWEPKRSMKESVESLVKWYKAHPKGFEN